MIISARRPLHIIWAWIPDLMVGGYYMSGASRLVLDLRGSMREARQFNTEV